MTDDDIPTPWIKSLPEKRPASLEYEEIPIYEILQRRAKNTPDKPSNS